MLRKRIDQWGLCVCVWLVAALPVSAQEDAPAEVVTEPSEVTQQRIDDFQKSVDAQSELDEDLKTRITELVGQATNDLKAAETARAQGANADQRTAGLETEKSDLERQIDQPTASEEIAPGQSVANLEAEQVELQAEITTLEERLKQPYVDQAARAANRTSLRTQLTELPARKEELDRQLKEPAPETESPLLSEARKLALSAQKQLVEARLSAARKELAGYDAADALNLPTLRREAYTRALNAQQKRLEALRNEVNARRQAEAERRALEAEQAKLSANPVLKPDFEKNLEIARTEQEVRAEHKKDEELLKEVEDRLKEVNDEFDKARDLAKSAGLENRGPWLRKQRDTLDELRTLYARVRERTDRQNDLQFSLFERQSQLEELNIELRAEQLTAEAAQAGDIDQDAFRQDALKVLRDQTVNLDKLIDEYSDYTDTLAALATTVAQLRTQAGEYGEFLDERILWVRSHLPLALSILTEPDGGLGDIVPVETWVAAAKSLGWDAADHLTLYGGVALLLLFLWLRRGAIGGQLREVAQQAGGRVNVSMKPTNHCLVLTGLLAVVWPGLMLFVAWRLQASSISWEQHVIAATNLMRLAGLFFLLEFLRQSIRPGGLADAHFDWNAKTLRRVRILLRSLMTLGLPLAIAVACLHQQGQGSRRDDLERLLFIGGMVVLMMFAHQLIHPRWGVLRQMRTEQTGGWSDRLGYLWYALGMAVPIGLIVLTYLGYYDSAVRLTLRVQRTAWLIVAAVYLYALFGRWLMLRHRRLRIQEARERLAASQESEGNTSEEAGLPLPDTEASQADLDASTQQSRRLLTTMLVVAGLIGLWWIWIDVLPAIRILDHWQLWSTTVETVVPEIDDDGNVVGNRTDVEVRHVTLVNLIQVLVIILLTTTATRNVPGLLEMSILARLPIDRSTSYAVTTLIRYGLVLIGMILAGRALALTWSSLQWLAAALTFGLGFGLQEIFANFVSGLIILFEQPVRVGDIVTIDGVTGVVNRIRIRATTIIDWDRKEYIVPNRDFITGRLLNWTLTDKTSRVVIEVGVAYGSNPQRVREVIMEILQEHPRILEEPAPLVTMESFGDSSLDFVARAYLPNLDNRLGTIHELHARIHDRFAEEGIQIPFPQRDLNLRTSVKIDDSLRRAASNNGPNGQTQTSEAPSESVS